MEDKKSMMALLQTIDRAGGYAFGSAEGANDSIWQVAVRQGMGQMDIRDIQERWIDNREEWDEKERREWGEEQKRREEEFGQQGAETYLGDGMDVDTKVPSNSGIKVRRSGQW